MALGTSYVMTYLDLKYSYLHLCVSPFCFLKLGKWRHQARKGEAVCHEDVGEH